MSLREELTRELDALISISAKCSQPQPGYSNGDSWSMLFPISSGFVRSNIEKRINQIVTMLELNRSP